MEVHPTYIEFENIVPQNIIFNNFVEFNPNDPQYNEVISNEKIQSTIGEIIDYYN